MSKADLRVDWATHEAAKYACERWHYSATMPPSKTAKLGAWENGRFIGVVVFGVGATADLCKQYGISREQGCELVRVALTSHLSPVSRIVAYAVKVIRNKYPGLKLCVSFADPGQGHCGGIYQTMNWVYTGMTGVNDEYLYKGKRWHGRAFRHKYKGLEHHPDVTIVKGTAKHRYPMPLDAEMRAHVLPLAKPYPKRPKQAESGPPETRRCDTDPDAPIQPDANVSGYVSPSDQLPPRIADVPRGTA